MTQLSREDIKALRISLSSWQGDYDPVDDAEQHEMFGRAMEAMDMLMAAEAQEPVAWMIIDTDTGKKHINTDRSDIEGPCTALYAAPQPVSVPEQCSDEDDLFQAPPHEFFEAISQSREYCASLSPTVIQRMAKSLAKHLREKPVAVPDLRPDWQTNEFSAGWNSCRAAMLQPSSWALQLPEGWMAVPVEPTTNQWAAGMQAFDSGMDKVTRVYKAMLAAAPVNQEFTTQAVDADTTSTQFESLSAHGKASCICIECGAAVINPEKPHRCVKEESTK
ncbi:hypothetical protein [Enterobacter sp.]|uniref:hypothetical protein n=1 Tax=Enterobacter sp. TaxID=42895 RepID=UPI00296ED9C5|nr:hypothetical protein [Enterobacter sp.]